MKDENEMPNYRDFGPRGVLYREEGTTGWFVAVIVVLALMAIGYLVFSANETADPKVTEKQAACMIANPGMDCEQVTRWEPITPESGEQKHG